MTKTMYDAVNVKAIPRDAKLVAGYVDGAWPTAVNGQLKYWCPEAEIVEITVRGRPGTKVADCERGDLTPSQAVQWAVGELGQGRRPTIYCNASTWPVVRGLLGGRASRVDWWIADYDNNPVIPAGAVAKQYKTGNVDVSVVSDDWPTPRPIPSPMPPPFPMPVVNLPVSSVPVLENEMPSTILTVPTDANGNGAVVLDGGIRSAEGVMSIAPAVKFGQFVSVTPWAVDPAADGGYRPIAEISVQDRGGWLLVTYRNCPANQNVTVGIVVYTN